MLGLVLQTQSAKSPAQRVTALFILIHIQRGEARAFGQEVTARNAVGQRGIAPLQKRDGGRNGGQITILLLCKGLHGWRAFFGGQGRHALGHGTQAVGREQLQHQR